MTEKKTLTLEQFKKKVGDQVPAFTQALLEENAYLLTCRQAREDLKKLRDGMGVTQAELAEKLQMTQPSVSKIENGEGDIGLLTLCRYAGALGLQPTITFSPAADAYLEHDRLRTVIRSLESLSDNRMAEVATADDDRHREPLAGEVATLVDSLLQQMDLSHSDRRLDADLAVGDGDSAEDVMKTASRFMALQSLDRWRAAHDPELGSLVRTVLGKAAALPHFHGKASRLDELMAHTPSDHMMPIPVSGVHAAELSRVLMRSLSTETAGIISAFVAQARTR